MGGVTGAWFRKCRKGMFELRGWGHPGVPDNEGCRGVGVQTAGPNYCCPLQQFILDLPKSQFFSAGLYFHPLERVWGLEDTPTSPPSHGLLHEKP